MSTHSNSRVGPKLALAAAMLAGVVAGPIAASSHASAVSGLREFEGSSASNSATLKTLTVGCPAFHHAIGGSAYIVGSEEVRILAVVPSGAGTSGSGLGIVASEQESGTTEIWRIEGTVICAPAANLPGLEYRNAQSSHDSATSHQVTASCSAGKRLIGMGGEAWYNNLSSRSQVALTGIRPDSSGTSVTVTGFEDETGFGGAWNVYATAVCVDAVAGGDPVPAVDGYYISEFKLAQPRCLPNTRVHSLGFDLTGPAGRGGEMHLTQMINVNDGEFGHLVAYEDGSGLSGSWRLRGYAICASN